MVLPKIEERTLYPPLIGKLKELGFEAIGETKVLTKHPDILFKIQEHSFVIEVKIGKSDIGLSAVAQAKGYANKLKTDNIIILIYPEKYSNQVILNEQGLDRIALDEKVTALILTQFWTESLTDTVSNIFTKLKELFVKEQVTIDFNTVVKLIESYVTDLNQVIYQIKTDELVSEVVSKLDLFASMGEIKDKKTAQNQVINLASYLLFNQLLFYHIYKRKTGSKKLKELENVKNIKEIQQYFDLITEIDYRSIYQANILYHIPNKPDVIKTLNETIDAVKLLRAEYITHDLAGRFFHDLIPFEVRKVLAAFYTHPIAANILAGLTIDSFDETVIDPSCGSGTLLVAAYQRKQELYQKLYGFKDLKKLHKQFVENDITGIDLMPFAAHLTTINLTMQEIEQTTNVVRIATMDSLNLANQLKATNFKKGGVKISGYERQIQKTIFGGEIIKKKHGAISPEGKGAEFYLKPVDIVIMNPPFSDREKMPKEMRDLLNQNKTLANICGNQINLWGYFIALSELLLKPNGKVAAVIPINIARGKSTENIRKFLFSNYSVEYIIKPVVDTAFSEGAAFKDILIIAKKCKPTSETKTKIVFLKKKKADMNEEYAKELVEQLKEIKEEKLITKDYEFFTITQKQIITDLDNLMQIIGGTSLASKEIFDEFNQLLIKNANKKLRKIESEEIREGVHASPAGFSELTFIVRPINKSRTKRNVLLELYKEDKTNISAITTTKEIIKIPNANCEPALKTLTGIKTLNINANSDYFITKEYAEFKKIKQFSKWKGDFSWEILNKKIVNKKTNLALLHRIRLNSKNTNLVAVYSDNQFYTTHAFTIFNSKGIEAKLIALFLNSSLGLFELLRLKKETTEGFLEFLENDFVLMNIPNIKEFSNKDINQIEILFKSIEKVSFPSLIEQFETRFKQRIEMDRGLLEIFGFSKSEINVWLPQLYNSILNELKVQ